MLVNFLHGEAPPTTPFLGAVRRPVRRLWADRVSVLFREAQERGQRAARVPIAEHHAEQRPFAGMTLRILLFSPVRGRDPESGDIAYTEALLADPPPGVTYTTYAEALDAGLVRVRGRRPRRGDAALLDLVLLIVRVGELSLRKVGVMFREPTWYVTIDPSAFDVVHQHLFAVRQIGSRVPVVSSAGYPLPILYGAREKWSARRLGLATALERAYAHVMNVHNPWLRCAPGNLMTVYSERFRDYLIGMGAHPEQVSVCSNAVADDRMPPSPLRRTHPRIHRSRLRPQRWRHRARCVQAAA